MEQPCFELLHITRDKNDERGDYTVTKRTHCRLRAALSLVWIQVQVLPVSEHCEHVGSRPSHLIFLRLVNTDRMRAYFMVAKAKLTCTPRTHAIHGGAEAGPA